MQTKCCGNCKNGHFGKCMDGKCVAEKYSRFVPANTHVVELLKEVKQRKEEALGHLFHVVEWFQNGC